MPDVIITALFDNRDNAQSAVDRLIALGVPVQNLHITAPDADDEASEDLDPRPLFDRIGDFFFPDEDRDILARGVEDGALMVTATGVPESIEAAAVRALDDAGAVEIDESDGGPHESALRDVAANVTSAPKPDHVQGDDPRLDDAAAVLTGAAALGDVDSGTSGMAGMDTPHAGVTADREQNRAQDRARSRRDASTRRVRSYWVDEAGTVENVAIERDNLPS